MGGKTMNNDKELKKAIGEISEIAKGFGLDFFPMHYEICPDHILYTFGAYGMPTRFNHWSFGKQFYKMKLHYNIGLSKIYELVINTNPCYAFLLNTNTLTQNKLIVAHVLAHSDFFKNNYYFKKTRRDMMHRMTATAERIRYYEKKYSKHTVETFIDAVLSIQEHIDPHKVNSTQKSPTQLETEKQELSQVPLHLQNINKSKNNIRIKVPEKDLLLFIEQHSPILNEWQRDVLSSMREEMYYFWPQLQTKILNEGWATYWHQRIIQELNLSDGEYIEFAKLHANIMQTNQQTVNPYYLGAKLFQYIEQKENKLKQNAGKPVIKKLFDIRETLDDVSFLRNYMTKEFVQEEHIFIYEKHKDQYIITEKDYKKVKAELLRSRMNGGYPYIVVQTGDFQNKGELYLVHYYEDIELDIPYLKKVLQYIYQLWGNSVHLETVVKSRKVVFSFDGKQSLQKNVH